MERFCTFVGGAISPLLANIYLNRLEEAGFAIVRYADDFVILCQTRGDAERALTAVQNWVDENDLTLHPIKTKIVDGRTKSFDFLGYSFRGKLRLPRAKSLKKLKDTGRKNTKRKHGRSMPSTCGKLRAQLQGWFTTFVTVTETSSKKMDGWIRGRLSSILRKRRKRRGRGRGSGHQRRPNAYFVEQGLYSLGAAHVRFVQSSMR